MLNLVAQDSTAQPSWLLMHEAYRTYPAQTGVKKNILEMYLHVDVYPVENLLSVFIRLNLTNEHLNKYMTLHDH